MTEAFARWRANVESRTQPSFASAPKSFVSVLVGRIWNILRLPSAVFGHGRCLT